MKFLTDRGSATVAIAGLIVVVMSAFSLGVAAIGILITKHKLESATDLAALSAAHDLPLVFAACQQAASELAVSGFQLGDCQGGDAWVRVQGRAEISLLAYPIELQAEATAGW
ncbi:MAG: hypothetical protein F2563_02115 [Actinobacteria bacterium]|jgi:secretion/DNA translocation related TadE-like protein|uniref:Unannotated protein n=1 Tax=freshwater metagenome TaxID=449393 RepID=A0A6J6EJJ9_9ZZZZ|nr:hypothetical protein [Actinomycetota bacterium]